MYQYYQPQPQYLQQQQVVRVTGEAGARSLRLPPNSSALALDNENPIVWLICTDGAGYATVTPYQISAYEPPKQPDMTELMERISRLEEQMHESHSSEIKPNENKQQCSF